MCWEGQVDVRKKFKTWDQSSEDCEQKLPRDEEKENDFKKYGAIK